MQQLWGTVYCGNGKASRREALRMHRAAKASIVVEFAEKRYGISYGMLIGYRECDKTSFLYVKTFAELMEIFRRSVGTLYELPTFLENGTEDLFDKQKIFARNSLVEKK